MEKLLQWLDERGRMYGDVMEDDNGYYVYIEGEAGKEKVYLPDEFEKHL